MGGGILPVALYKDKFYFLFSREYNKSDRRDSGMWSDFGGSSEPNESIIDTSIREGWEESVGFLGNKSQVGKLVYNNTIKTITKNNHTTYIILIDYDKNLPNMFNNNFSYLEKNIPSVICKNGFYEKDKLKWIEYSNIKKNMDIFRPYYKELVKVILSEFN